MVEFSYFFEFNFITFFSFKMYVRKTFKHKIKKKKNNVIILEIVFYKTYMSHK